MQETGKKKLDEYLQSEKYVFHGTISSNIEKFEPRQTYNWINGKKVKDGKPAVFASKNIEIPIFFSIFRNIEINNSSFGAGEYDGKIFFRATKNMIDYLKKNKIKGYVYVFEKKYFFERDNKSKWLVCENKVKPVDVVEVTNSDIVLEIKEID